MKKPQTTRRRFWRSFRLSLSALLSLSLLLGIGFFYLYLDSYTRPARRDLCCETPADLGFTYEDITFTSPDGVVLSGWYIPSHNRAAVILLHGGGGDRRGMLPHASYLAQHGFGVLLYDQRACGESQGKTRSYGWLDVPDALAAVEYLQGRSDVDAHRIGMLGASLGGQIAIRAAAQTDQIKAVVSDGTSIAVAGDLPPALNMKERVLNALNYLMDWGLSLKTGSPPPAGVVEVIDKISPRAVLLIAGGNTPKYPDWELRNGRHMYQAAGEPKELWEVPEADHTGGLAKRPEEYAQRVIQFFTKALLPSQ